MGFIHCFTSLPGFTLTLAHVSLVSALLWTPARAEVVLTTRYPEFPVLRGKPVNPVMEFTVRSAFSDAPPFLEGVELEILSTSAEANIAEVFLCKGSESDLGANAIIATAKPSKGIIVLRPPAPIATAGETFWISVGLTEDADLNARVILRLHSVQLGGQRIAPSTMPDRSNQRIGVALRQRGDDGVDSYRIPGLARTNAGSLIAVYDMRHLNCKDLPGRIDVGVSRSTNEGQDWSLMQIAMTPGSMGEKYADGGIGDPAILVDRSTGRIWIAALWGHGDIGWNTSKPGMSPEETGQLLLTFSDDDGLTWSPLRNITPSIKEPKWRLCFNSPGAGICLHDGTLVFPAMFRAADGGNTDGKPYATVLSSRDHGESWQIGSGARIDTTESQIAELADGTLMLNARDNRGGTRTVMTTGDLGLTWQPHASDRTDLVDPVCMAGLLNWNHPRHGALLLFSNPANSTERKDMTIKISPDQGMSWPQDWQLRFDSRLGSGYSCLAPAGADHVGVIYEGKCEIYFLRIPLTDIIP